MERASQQNDVAFHHEGVPYTSSQVEEAIDAYLRNVEKPPADEAQFFNLIHDCRADVLVVLSFGRDFRKPLVNDALAFEEVTMAVRKRLLN